MSLRNPYRPPQGLLADLFTVFYVLVLLIGIIVVDKIEKVFFRNKKYTSFPD